MPEDMDTLFYDSIEKYGDSEVLIKNAQETLTPYFENAANLKSKVMASHLISAYNIINKYTQQSDHIFFDGFQRTLALYRNAYSISQNEVISICVKSHNDFLQKESFMHAMKQSFVSSYSDLSGALYRDVANLMTQINQNVELGMQNIIREMLLLSRISKNSGNLDYDNFKGVKLGVATNELAIDSTLKELFWTYPADISISDWRNIVAHSTYSIRQNIIECSCRNGKKQFTTTIEGLFIYLSQIVRASNAINIARCIFGYEHLEEISEAISAVKTTADTSIPLLMSNVRTELLKEDFDIIPAPDIKNSDNETSLMVYDLLASQNEIKRADQLAKHIYLIWRALRKTIIVIYCNRDKIAKYYIRAENSDCKLVSKQATKKTLPILIRPIKLI